jgi:hypothetical protein
LSSAEFQIRRFTRKAANNSSTIINRQEKKREKHLTRLN